MGVRNRIVTTAILLGVVSAARADVTGSFDGQLAVKKAAPVASAATFTQAGKLVTGTIVLDGDAASGGGVFLLQNGSRATAKLLKVKALAGAARLTFTGKIKGDTIRGKVVVRGAKRSGTLTLTRNVSIGDGSACDAVYVAHQQQFNDDLVQPGGVLNSCTQCHIAGGQAQSTRFKVDVANPLATARSIALLVSSSNPASSRILVKPTRAVPHGGLQVIVPGSADETKLRAWVDLVAAAQCNGL